MLCEIDLMILFICQNLSDLFRHGKLTQGFTLSHAIAILANGLVFVFEIKTKHLSGIARGPHGLWRDCLSYPSCVSWRYPTSPGDLD